MNERYLGRMRARLEDYAAYAHCLCEPPVRAIRVNTLKISAERFAELAPFSLEAVPWERNGFYIAEERPGKSFYHDAGLYYVQEPSAMAVAPLLAVQPGERVLDLCSAPGGKGTQLAQAMRGKGILVLNEKLPDRAFALLQNVERLGISNAVVTCADPAELAQRFCGYFDKILVDAPCSGEGMFRKDPAAAKAWSEELVAMCAARQKKILASAVEMLAPGGTLVYSTCTFAEEEDEENAAWLAQTYPQLRRGQERKLYPHRCRGEGHYAAQFFNEGERAPFSKRGRGAPLADKRTVAAYRAFEREFLQGSAEGEFCLFGSALSLVPEGLFDLRGLRVLRAGLMLGELRGGRFEPAHALAMAASAPAFLCSAELDEAQAERYFAGEPLEVSAGKGWCAVTFGGYALGLGKSVGGVVKNHLPKGLRRKSGNPSVRAPQEE